MKSLKYWSVIAALGMWMPMEASADSHEGKKLGGDAGKPPVEKTMKGGDKGLPPEAKKLGGDKGKPPVTDEDKKGLVDKVKNKVAGMFK